MYTLPVSIYVYTVPDSRLQYKLASTARWHAIACQPRFSDPKINNDHIMRMHACSLSLSHSAGFQPAPIKRNYVYHLFASYSYVSCMGLNDAADFILASFSNRYRSY